jgi:ABC-2 type transport system ATP-binding protein
VAPEARAAAREPAIRTTGLSKRFGQVRAVDGLAVEVARGEVFGLVGPDGAGKTTTIRLLTAVGLPTSGRALVLGCDTVHDAEAIKGRVGYMAQRFTLYRDLTVVENLRFFADVFGVRGPERAERIERLLGFARLGPFRDRRADHLSGGMQKKLGLACTLVHSPELLFLDEPTTGVDPVSRREFWAILADLHLQGITIFASTPYMDEAERCTRVGLLYRGRLIQCDTPERIRALVPGDMLEIRLGDVRRARPLVASLEGVSEVQVQGESLRVLVDDAGRRSGQIREALGRENVAVTSLRATRPGMQEAFISLIEGATAQAER